MLRMMRLICGVAALLCIAETSAVALPIPVGTVSLSVGEPHLRVFVPFPPGGETLSTAPDAYLTVHASFTGLDSGESISVYGFNETGGIWFPVPLFQVIGGIWIPVDFGFNWNEDFFAPTPWDSTVFSFGGFSLAFWLSNGEAELTGLKVSGRNAEDEIVELSYDLSSEQPVPVVEPGTLALLGAGLLGLGVLRRRRAA
jgi:hypothetical protein